MNKLEELKNQVSQIMEENKPSVIYNSKEDRRIRELEVELTNVELKCEFSALVSDLDSEMSEQPFGGSGFSREQYALSWKLWKNDTYRLFLTNIPHQNSKLLLTAPDSFKKDASVLLGSFAEKFVSQFKDRV